MAKVKKIFVVDDDEMIRAMLSDNLKKNPMNQVETFSTGEECLANLNKLPDVIVLDYQLNSVDPNAGDGLQILEQIKKANKQLCVIMLSSQTQYSKAVQTVVKGALEYVVKDDNAFKRVEKIIDGL